jgi:DNA-binding NarL/FixJ family response regulator
MPDERAAKGIKVEMTPYKPEKPLGPPLPELTPREREVLGLVAEGLTNRQIADRLVVSEHTVHRHLTNLMRKLGVTSRTAAAAIAVRSGVTGEPRR